MRSLTNRASCSRADNGQLRCGGGRLKDEAGLAFGHRAQLSESLAQVPYAIQIELDRVSAIKLEGSLKGHNLFGQSCILHHGVNGNRCTPRKFEVFVKQIVSRLNPPLVQLMPNSVSSGLR